MDTINDSLTGKETPDDPGDLAKGFCQGLINIKSITMNESKLKKINAVKRKIKTLEETRRGLKHLQKKTYLLTFDGVESLLNSELESTEKEIRSYKAKFRRM